MKIESKRNQTGIKNNGAKLNNAVVSNAKGLLKKGLTQKRVSEITDIHKANLWCIAKNLTWKHVKPNLSVAVPPPAKPPKTKTCPKCHQNKPIKLFPKRAQSRHGVNSYCKRCKNELSVADGKRIRESVIKLLGGCCACCNESRREFLAIDHVNGGGSQERKALSVKTLCRRLLKGTYSRTKVRILCHNCNVSLGIYGYCPHKLAAAHSAQAAACN